MSEPGSAGTAHSASVSGGCSRRFFLILPDPPVPHLRMITFTVPQPGSATWAGRDRPDALPDRPAPAAAEHRVSRPEPLRATRARSPRTSPVRVGHRGRGRAGAGRCSAVSVPDSRASAGGPGRSQGRRAGAPDRQVDDPGSGRGPVDDGTMLGGAGGQHHQPGRFVPARAVGGRPQDGVRAACGIHRQAARPPGLRDLLVAQARGPPAVGLDPPGGRGLQPETSPHRHDGPPVLPRPRLGRFFWISGQTR